MCWLDLKICLVGSKLRPCAPIDSCEPGAVFDLWSCSSIHEELFVSEVGAIAGRLTNPFILFLATCLQHLPCNLRT